MKKIYNSLISYKTYNIKMAKNLNKLSLSIEDIKVVEYYEKEEYQFFLSLVSGMVFTAPYESYVINIINNIIKDNYKNISPFLCKGKYKFEEIINEFKTACYNLLEKEKKKKIINKSLDIKEPNKNSSLFLINSNLNKKNKSDNKNITTINESKIDTFNSLKNRVSFERIFFDEEEEVENKFLSKIIVENKSPKKVKFEINDFIDSFNFNGKEYEIHSQILIMQILKCLEEKENSFKFLCNLEFKQDNTSSDLDEMEFDFVINNLDDTLFKKFVLYLEKNILLLNFKGNIYEIKKGNKNNNLIFPFEKDKKFDILGEIGLNALFDERKILQFKKYVKFLNCLNNSGNKLSKEIEILIQKTGFKKENEKIIFLVTNSKFNDIYKNLEKSRLYIELKEANINFVLFYISVGLNEKIILSNYLINNKKKNKDLLNKIKETNDGFIRSEQFKKSCYKLNELLIRISKISDLFYKKKKSELSLVMNKFSNLIFKKKLSLNKIVNKYFEYIKLPINDLYNDIFCKKPEFFIIYLKSGFLQQDNVIEKMKKMNIYIEIIILESDENLIKKYIKNIKERYKIEIIYLFICNYDLLNAEQIEQFVNKLIQNIKINKAHSIFIYNDDGNNLDYKETLINNINIAKNENQLIQMLNNTIDKINLIYYGLLIILKEKKYYDIYIKIYFEKTMKKISDSIQSNENDIFLLKINEILNFMLNLEFKENVNDIITEKLIENIYAYINKLINDFMLSEFNDDIERVFDEISIFFSENKELLELSKSKTKDYCHQYLKQCILHYIYSGFIRDIIPQISFNIYNKKVETYLKKNSKNIGKRIERNNIDYFEYL